MWTFWTPDPDAAELPAGVRVMNEVTSSTAESLGGSTIRRTNSPPGSRQWMRCRGRAMRGQYGDQGT